MGSQKFLEATSNDIQDQDELHQFDDHILQKQCSINFFVQAMALMTGGAAIYHACSNVMQNVQEKVVSSSTTIKEHDYKTLRTYLGWPPLEVVKRTFACTTQLAM
eukprot:5988194-Ditylum_brightwellii.AAC.1